jgi:hypothetical protein
MGCGLRPLCGCTTTGAASLTHQHSSAVSFLNASSRHPSHLSVSVLLFSTCNPRHTPTTNSAKLRRERKQGRRVRACLTASALPHCCSTRLAWPQPPRRQAAPQQPGRAGRARLPRTDSASAACATSRVRAREGCVSRPATAAVPRSWHRAQAWPWPPPGRRPRSFARCERAAPSATACVRNRTFRCALRGDGCAAGAGVGCAHGKAPGWACQVHDPHHHAGHTPGGLRDAGHRWHAGHTHITTQPRAACMPTHRPPPHAHTHVHTQWFDAIDKDGDNQLSAMELQAALQLGNLNFSLATVAHIIRRVLRVPGCAPVCGGRVGGGGRFARVLPRASSWHGALLLCAARLRQCGSQLAVVGTIVRSAAPPSVPRPATRCVCVCVCVTRACVRAGSTTRLAAAPSATRSLQSCMSSSQTCSRGARACGGARASALEH